MKIWKSGAMNIDTLPLIPILDEKLIELLQSLTPEEWQMQTIARLWNVKDVAAHLLDGNIRGISTSRDQHFVQPDQSIDGFHDLVHFINRQNIAWTEAARRMSPRVLISLLEFTGKEYYEHVKTLDPEGKAIFSVAWAGEDSSNNRFHIAREYTEKFLHQQQIRDAVGRPGIMTRELYLPFIHTFIRALPYTFRDVDAKSSTLVCLEVTSELGGLWSITKVDGGWEFCEPDMEESDVSVQMDPDTAWKLFSKSLSPEDVRNKVRILGDIDLGNHVLHMISVMA